MADEWDALALEVKSETEAQSVKRNLTTALDVNPDKQADINKLSAKSGVPAFGIDTPENEAWVKNLTRVKDLDPEGMVKTHPMTAKALQDENFAKIAHDDIENIKGLEDSFSAIGRTPSTTVDEVLAMTEKQAAYAGYLMLAYGPEGQDVDGMAEFIAGRNRPMADAQTRAPEYFKDFQKRYQESEGFLSTAGVLLTSPMALGRIAATNIPNMILPAATSIGGAKVGAPIGAGIGTAFPVVGTAAGAGAGAIVGATTGGFAGGSLVDIAAWMDGELSDGGYDVTDAKSIAKAFRDPQFIDNAKKRAEAKGLTTAGIDALWNATFAGRFLKGMTPNKTLADLASNTGKAVKDVGVQAVGESVSEAGGQFAATGEVDTKDALLEGVSSLGQSVFDTSLYSNIRKGDVDQAVRAVADQKLAEVSGGHDAAMKLKTVQRDPAAVRAMVEAAHPDARVYVDGEVATKYFQELDPDTKIALTEAIPDIEQKIQEANASGSDVMLNRSDYIAYIASNEGGRVLMEHVKFDRPDDLTVAQLSDPDYLQGLYEVPQNSSQISDTDIQNFQERIVEEIQASGRVGTQQIARESVAPLAAFVQTMRERGGSEAVTQSLIDGIEVKGPARPPTTTLDLTDKSINDMREYSARIDTLFRAREKSAQTRRAKAMQKAKDEGRVYKEPKPRGQSKNTPVLKFLGKMGGVKTGSPLAGELRGMDITPKTAPWLFKKDTGLSGLDTISATDINFEIGSDVFRNQGTSQTDTTGSYVDPEDIISAIQSELFGNPVVDNSDPMDAAYEDFTRYLSELGLDIDTATNEQIKEALKNPEAFLGNDEVLNAETDADGVSYNQSGEVITDSQAFKNWFGDSKVVDEDGKPLVVYHGTGSDIEIFNTNGGTGKTFDTGAFFTSNAAKAATYAVGKNKNVMPVYLALKNPVIIDAGGKNWNRIDLKSKIEIPSIEQDSTEDNNLLFELGIDTSNNPKTQKIKGKTTTLKKLFKDEVFDEDTFSTDDLARWAKKQGYESVIIKNVVDRGPSGQFATPDANIPSDLYVAFEPTQIKSVNNRGTFDPNDPRILYQSPISDEKLMVVHNLSAKNLVNADKIGGLAIPSLAVTKTNIEFDSFGDITLIAPSSMADPQADRANKTFDTDVYSPRYPSVIYETDRKKLNAFIDEIKKINGEVNFSEANAISERIESDGLEGALDNRAVKYAFLKEKGQVPDPVFLQKKKTIIDDVPSLKKFVGMDNFDLAKNEEFLDGVKQFADRKIKEDPRLKEIYYEKDDELNFNIVRSYARDVSNYSDAPEIDTYETGKVLNDFDFGQEEYRSWVENKMSGVITNEKIFNGFTNSGNRRYLPHNLDTVVKIMKGKIQGAEGFNYGIPSIRAVMAKKFRSLKDIKKDSDRLITSEQMENVKKEIQGDFDALFDRISKKIEGEYKFGDLDNFSNILADIGEKGRYSILDSFYKNITQGDKDAVKVFLDKLKNLPTQYFEVKVQRPVKLNEFVGALVADNTPDAALKILNDNNIPYAVYKRSDKGERSKVTEQFVKQLNENPRSQNRVLFQAENAIQIKNEGDISGLKTGQAVTFDFAHNTESATKLFGKPKKDAPYGRGFEPSGRYVTLVADKEKVTGKTMTSGTLTFRNPLVLDNNNLQWKEDLSQKYDGKTGKKLSLAVIADGYDGIITIDKDHTSEIVDFTTFDETKALYQKNRGQVSIMRDGRYVVKLFETSNLSTFLHETGHIFLDAFNRYADAPDAPEQFLKDREAIFEYLGVKSYGDIKTKEHEKFARAFEAYLMSGEAPSVGLQSAFRKFKAWLTRIYQSLTGLNAPVTPELKAVFDRMLATDQEIAQVQNKNDGFDINKDLIAILPKADQERYERLHNKALEQARENLLKKTLKDVERQTTKWWKEERAKLKEQIEGEVNSDPVYRAMEFLTKGKYLPNDNWVELPPIKIARADAEKILGKTIMRSLPKGMFAKNGISADDFAEVIGYVVGNGQDGFRTGNGNELLYAIANAEDRKARVERLTNEGMISRHGDLLTDGGIEKAAIEAFNTDAQALKMEMEGKATAKLAGLPFGSNTNFELAAQKILASKNVRDATNVDRFYVATIRASKAYGKALRSKNYAVAVKAKQQQLLSHHLYKQAIEARRALETSLQSWNKLKKPDEKLTKSMDINYIYVARAILGRYGVLPYNAGNLQTYFSYIQEADPDAYEDLILAIQENTRNVPDAETQDVTYTKGKMAGQTITKTFQPWTKLTLEEFFGLKDTIDNVLGVGKNQKTMLVDGQRIEREQVLGELEERLSKLPETSISDGQEKALEWHDRGKLTISGIRAGMRRVENWANVMDGKYGGVFRKYVWNPINDARGEYLEAKNEYLTKMAEILKPHSDNLNNSGKIAAEEIGYTFHSKAELIGMVLHMGNESNWDKLWRGGRGRAWNPANLQSMMDRMMADGTLTKEDMDLVQSLWDLVNGLKPDAQKAHKAMYGYYFSEITSWPIQTPWGEYKGGYWPAIPDNNLSQDARIRQDQENLISVNNSSMFPTTGRGFTKSRVEGYAAPLSFDLRLLPSHVDKVLRFVHLEPSVKDVAKLMNDRKFRKMMDRVDPKAIEDMLIPWLQRVARQTVETNDSKWFKYIDPAARWLRASTSAQTMMLNFLNAVQQVTGFAPAIYKVGARPMGRALVQYMKNPIKAHEMIYESSTFMKYRNTILADNMQKTVVDIVLNTSKYNRVVDAAKAHGYIFQQVFQSWVDGTTWMAAYDNAVAEGMNEKEAVRYADSIVRETQGSTSAEDLSKYEAGPATMRLFTMFYSYFNTQSNLILTDVQNIMRTTDGLDKTKKLGYLYLMLYAIPSFSAELIVRSLKGDLPDDEDDDGTVIDDWLAWFVGSQQRYATAMVPFIGQVANSVVNAFDKKPFNDKIQLSPIVGMAETLARTPKSIYEAVADDGDVSRAVQNTLTSLGFVTGLPLGQFGKPLGYAADVMEGDTEIDSPLDPLRGIIAGPPPADKR